MPGQRPRAAATPTPPRSRVPSPWACRRCGSALRPEPTMTHPAVPTRGPLPGSGTRAGVQLLRFAVDDGAAALVRHVWVPLWSLPPGERVVQELLQYPGGNVVVMADEAGFYGVDTGLGTRALEGTGDRKSTRLNSSHVAISYAVFCLKTKIQTNKIV